MEIDLSIPGLDTAAGIKGNGSEEHYIRLLGDVYELIDKKCEEIEGYMRSGDIKAFTTGVHSLKTTCRMIGHMPLSESFYALEKLGNEEKADEAFLLAPETLGRFRELKPLLEPYAAKHENERVPIPTDDLISLLAETEAAAAGFEISAAEAFSAKLLTCECSDELYERFKQLSGLISNLDYSDAASLAASIRESVADGAT